jgi:hypothetical protein
MTTPIAILIGAVLIAASVFATGLYRIENTAPGVAYRINSLTGSVAFCSYRECRTVPAERPTAGQAGMFDDLVPKQPVPEE